MSAPSDSEHPLYEKPEGQERIQVSATSDGRKRVRRPREDQPRLTMVLVAINALIFAAMMFSAEIDRQFMIHGALYPPFVVYQGQVYRLFTAMFLHGGLAHVLFNMYALYIVGNTVEPIFGRLRFLAIYFLGGLTGSALSLALGDPLSPSVGASGAVFALFAAEATHLYQHRGVYANVKGRLRHMLFLIGMNLVIGLFPGSRIDNWGHIGGVLGGFALAWRIAPRLSRPAFPPRSMREFARSDANPIRLRLPELVIYVFVLIGVIVIAINALPAQMPNLVP